MARASSKSSPSGYPEYAVRREIISRYFDPPLARSTFHDLVNKGKIIPIKGLRGYYRLNDSLRRLGLREVPHLPKESKRTTEDILRLAFTQIDPLIFPAPAWMLAVEELDPKDVDHAMVVAGLHRETIEALESVTDKLAYFGGVLDAQAVLEPPAPGSVRETTSR
jgi:hypothetical protein